MPCVLLDCVFFFNDTATTEIYTLSLHDALPISSPRTLVEDESRAADGVQQRRGPGHVDLPANPAHVHVDQVGEPVVGLVPAALEEHGAGHELAGVAHEVLEDGKLLGRERHRDATAPDLEAAAVELEVAPTQHERDGRRAAPAECVHARHGPGKRGPP